MEALNHSHREEKPLENHALDGLRTHVLSSTWIPGAYPASPGGLCQNKEGEDIHLLPR